MQSSDLLATISAQFRHDQPPVKAVLASSDPYPWHNIAARMYLLDASPTLLPTLEPSMHVLILHLAGAVQLSRIYGKRYETSASGPGSVYVMPHQEPVTHSWDKPVQLMHVYVPHAAVIHAAEAMQVASPATVELLDRFNVQDSFLYQMGQTLLAEIQSGGRGGRVYAETLGQALVMYLVRQHSSLVARREPRLYRLHTAELQRIAEYINDHLGDDLSLDALAAVANISPSHFARVFKRSIGLAPHQYLIKQRVERARALLETSSLTVAQIAQRVGFADHSHLVRHFKRIYGVPPTIIAGSARAQEEL